MVGRGDHRLSALCLRVAVTWGLQCGGLGVPAGTHGHKETGSIFYWVPSPRLHCLPPAVSWLPAAGGRLLPVCLCAPSFCRNKWLASSLSLLPSSQHPVLPHPHSSPFLTPASALQEGNESPHSWTRHQPWCLDWPRQMVGLWRLLLVTPRPTRLPSRPHRERWGSALKARGTERKLLPEQEK